MKNFFMLLLTFGIVNSTFADDTRSVSEISTELLETIQALRKSEPDWLIRERKIGGGSFYLESTIMATDSKYLGRCFDSTDIPRFVVPYDQNKMCRKHYVPIINEIVSKRDRMFESVAPKFQKAFDLTQALQFKLSQVKEQAITDRGFSNCIRLYDNLSVFFDWHRPELIRFLKGYNGIKDLKPVTYSSDNGLIKQGEDSLANYYLAISSLKNALEFYLKGTAFATEEMIVSQGCLSEPVFN